MHFLKLPQLSKEQWVFIIFGSLIKFLSGSVSSLQSPFFPREAEDHGLSATEYGMVMALFDFSVLVTSLIFGSCLQDQHMMKALKVAPVIEGVACIVFGFIDGVENKITFTVVASMLRVTEGLGKALHFIAFMKLTNGCFKDHRFAITLAESFQSTGWIVAPAIGGIVYEVFGFVGPFAVVGGLLTILSLLAVILIDNMPVVSSTTKNIENKKYTDILKIPMVWILLSGLFMYSVSWRLFYVGFEPHIRDFDLTETQVGLVFIIGAVLFPAAKLFWGRFTSTNNFVISLIFTTALAILGYSLIGPLQFLPLKKTLIITCLGYGIFGLGSAGVLIISMISFNEIIEGSILGNGVWLVVFSLGNVLGALGGGILIDAITFVTATLLVTICFTLIIFILIFILISKKLS